MSQLPDVVLTVEDGALGITPALPANTQVKAGVCSAGAIGTLYGFSDSTAMQKALGQGQLVEALASAMAVAGGPMLAIPVNPSAFGYAGSVTEAGIGYGTMAVSLAPAQQILITITTAGIIGTGAFTWQVGSGPVSQPVLTTSAMSSTGFLVPGTLTVLTFAAGTYVLASTYTFAATGGAATIGGGGINTVTAQSSPLDQYQLLVTVTASGGVAGPVAKFTYSLDNGNTFSAPVSMPSSGKYAVPGTGLVLTFSQHAVLVTITTPGALGTAVFKYSIDGGADVTANATTPNSGANFVFTVPGTGLTITFAPGSYVGSSTYSFPTTSSTPVLGGSAISTVTAVSAAFNASDKYSCAAQSAGYSTTDLTDAFTSLFAKPNLWFMLHAVGTPASASAASSVASTCDTQLTAAATNFRYAMALVECPTVGSIIVSGSAAIADTADTDNVLTSTFQNFVSVRTSVAAGDCDLTSPLTGRIVRRNAAWPIAARLSLIPPGEDAGRFARGALPSVKGLYRDEQATPALDAVRFCTLRTFLGESGFYVTNAYTMALSTSDFKLVANRRVMDLACQVTRSALLRYLNGGVRVNPTTGYILEQDAKAIENDCNGQLQATLVDSSPANASGSTVQLSRTANILSTATEPVTVRVTPLAYLKTISVDIGFFNPALQ